MRIFKLSNYISNFHLILLLIYPLFALQRIKSIFSPSINGINGTNEVFLLLIILLFLSLVKILKGKVKIYHNTTKTLFAIFLLFVVVITGFYKVQEISQFIYAISIFLLPILLIFIFMDRNTKSIILILKLIVFFSIIYSLLNIYASINYIEIMNYIGRDTFSGAVNEEGQFRANLMLGSSITVAYYFNITLPIILYLFLISKRKFWKKILFVAIILNILATVVTLSRSGFYISLITLFYFFIINSSLKTIKKYFVFIIITFILLIFVFQNIEASRLLSVIDIQDDSSRFEAIELALRIFRKSPFTGSGMASYYQRLYSERFIVVDNFSGLIDPHNGYLLVLSELGIIGVISLGLLYVSIFNTFRKINLVEFRKAATTVLLVSLLVSASGSQLVNEISISIIFWIYLAIFYRIKYLNNLEVKEIVNAF